MGNIVFENKKKKMQSQTTYSNFNFWVQEVFSKVRDFCFSSNFEIPYTHFFVLDEALSFY